MVFTSTNLADSQIKLNQNSCDCETFIKMFWYSYFLMNFIKPYRSVKPRQFLSFCCFLWNSSWARISLFITIEKNQRGLTLQWGLMKFTVRQILKDAKLLNVSSRVWLWDAGICILFERTLQGHRFFCNHNNVFRIFQSIFPCSNASEHFLRTFRLQLIP